MTKKYNFIREDTETYLYIVLKRENEELKLRPLLPTDCNYRKGMLCIVRDDKIIRRHYSQDTLLAFLAKRGFTQKTICVALKRG
jgi:hypothetical protein